MCGTPGRYSALGSSEGDGIRRESTCQTVITISSRQQVEEAWKSERNRVRPFEVGGILRSHLRYLRMGPGYGTRTRESTRKHASTWAEECWHRAASE